MIVRLSVFNIQTKMLSKYYHELPSDVKVRYFEKLKCIDNCDPYCLNKEDLISIESAPEVQIMDIINYFVLSHSFYSGQQLKAYKSLEAFKFYEAGFIVELGCAKIKNNFVIIGQVKHSQRMNDKLLQTWIILQSDGSILSAHCTCMAGLGEVCSHSAAIAFALHFRTLCKDQQSCTDQLASWPVPSVSKAVTPMRISEINWGKKAKSSGDAFCGEIAPLEKQSLHEFLTKLNLVNPSAAILSVVEPFAQSRKPKRIENLPMILTDLYSSDLETLSLEDLKNVFVDISITNEEQVAVQQITLKQNKSAFWYKFRSGRITGSIFKNACHTSPEKPSLSLVKGICYPQAILFKTKATTYGLEHEGIAREAYLDFMKQRHQNFTAKTVGFIISLENSTFGASPDAIICCDCCGEGCVEIKCPYRLKDSNIDLETFSSMKGTFLIKDDDGIFTLDKKHSYFYQIQLQMYVTKTAHCDFVLWSKTYLFIKRIYIDFDFLELNIAKACIFHNNVIFPELLSRYYTQSRENVQTELWCICKEPDDGRKMIRCANEDCPVKFFHLNCVKIKKTPNAYWFCGNCSQILY